MHVLDVAPQSCHAAETTAQFAALPRIRLAEPFEDLRDASDRMLAANGARPKVFLANLGKLSDFTARTLFARNFFEAGGIEAVSNDGFASRDEMIAAFKASGAKLACLCSSDKVYAAEAADAAKALKAAGASHIYLAGRPGEMEGGTEGRRRAGLHLRRLRRAGGACASPRYPRRRELGALLTGARHRTCLPRDRSGSPWPSASSPRRAA